MEEDKRPLPEGWRWVRLGDVCDRIDYGFTASADFSIGEPRFLRITDIQKGFVNWKTVPGCKITTEEEAANILGDGDIVFARTGATTGKSFLIQRPPRAVFASYLIRLRLKSDVIPSFIYGFFQSEDYWNQIRANARGGAQPNVNATLLSEIALPLPPLEEQKRIAAILNEQIAAVERARAAAETQLEAAKALPAAYLRAVFSSPKAQKWTRKRLDDVSKLLPSKSIATDGDAEVQAITTACLSEGGFLADGIKTARMSSKGVAECTLVRGEILVARSNTPELVGRVAMFPGEPKGAVASDLTIRIWPMNDITAEFLTAYLSFLYQTGYWKERAGGASGSMKKITREQIQAQQIPVPDVNDQQRIATTLNEHIASAELARKATEEELDAINKLPAALLRRAFAGDL